MNGWNLLKSCVVALPLSLLCWYGLWCFVDMALEIVRGR